MRVLLFGDYSNVHWTLAEGLRTLGHEVLVVSNGDGWKNYSCDISLVRKWHYTQILSDQSGGDRKSSQRRRTFFLRLKYLLLNKLGGLIYLVQLRRVFKHLRGYDIVQIVNPVFLDLKAERIKKYYKLLRRNNAKVFMGAFGMDKYWVKAGLDCKTFRYSDFNIGNHVRDNVDIARWRREWLYGEKGKLNDYIAQDCDGIIAGLYEYQASYEPYFADKLQFIPFPINIASREPKVRRVSDGVVKFLVGIQRDRSEYKGTDIMLQALQRVKADYPDKCEIKVVESLPFKEYLEVLDSSHVLLDQLYSYTPAMNALQAMAQGLVVVSGGEPENYQILNETELRPIVNVQPTEQSVYDELVKLVLNPQYVEILSKQSVEYVGRHHDFLKIAQKYVEFWQKAMPTALLS